MKNKLIIMVLLFLQTTLAMATLSNNEVNEIVKRGKLVVGMYVKDNKPFYYVDKDGQLTGYDVVLMEGFARSLGVQIEFDRSAKTLNDVVTMVENHDVDLGISKLSMTFERARRVHFSKPYAILHQSVLFNRIELAKQLKGRTEEQTVLNMTGKVGVLAKSVYADYAKHFEGVEVVQYPVWGDAVRDAADGKLIAAYRDGAETRWLLKEHPEYAIKLKLFVLKDAVDPKAVVIPRDSNELETLLGRYLELVNWQYDGDKAIFKYEQELAKLKQKIAMQERL